MDFYSRKELPRYGFIVLHLVIAAIFLVVILSLEAKENTSSSKRDPTGTESGLMISNN